MNMSYESYVATLGWIGKFGGKFILAAMFLEGIFALALRKSIYRRDDVLTDVGFYLIRLLFLATLFSEQVGILRFFYDHRVFTWAVPFPIRFILVLLLADFVRYLGHRIMHQNAFLWSLHSTHHTVETLNVISAFRFNSLLVFFDSLTYIPLLLLGVHPLELFAMVLVCVAWQSICHTQFKIPFGPLEGWILSPAAHRVHHARNPQYIDKNYGALFLIWDRMFGTYEPEVIEPDFKLQTPLVRRDPISLTFGPLLTYFQRKK